MQSYPGVFIAFEGGEGTGKSTQIRKLQAQLESDGHEVLVTWEPGGTPLGQKIREMLLDPDFPPMDARCELLLFAAARAQHVSTLIEPALQKGQIVLCDRFWDASRAYQGAGRNLGFMAVDRINNWGTRGCFPDKVFLFDLAPEKGLKRAAERNAGKLDRLEQEAMSFHENVREAYLKVAHNAPDFYHIIEADRDRGSIFNEIYSLTHKLLSSKNFSQEAHAQHK